MRLLHRIGDEQAKEHKGCSLKSGDEQADKGNEKGQSCVSLLADMS